MTSEIGKSGQIWLISDSTYFPSCKILICNLPSSYRHSSGKRPPPQQQEMEFQVLQLQENLSQENLYPDAVNPCCITSTLVHSIKNVL
ncbi:hypothetical protein [Scytonema sp. NUACC26]|uniref:hypothetical protein n=1 Tax=Scytonema sp. NUACC26 TaxID=3140176 RepID=UPI0038B36333